MSLVNVPAGSKTPDEFNVVIEIPMNSDPIKYEICEETGALLVDRIMLAAMHYPLNYGYIPQTLSLDGDPVDVLVKTPYPIQAGAVIKCRTIGVLEMEDEAGVDAKLIAVPVDKLYPVYASIQSIEDLPELERAQIKHFFEHYKDLEKGKWVKVTGWNTAEVAKKEITASVERFNAK
ncbi:inorganic pyrophosphatase [Oligella sp. HMSC05A10]|uniref:inorganic diphosphatase n=1 Tax=Oligella sp. HMSC05A10 TaxID=1581112 RepID=UPI0008A383F2|nr:inorganic diphosphatase [Oligella sp. HMSC05A10]OFS84698.1 inorganic pyrophosphatase [Oligella sp. HMSC05A10]